MDLHEELILDLSRQYNETEKNAASDVIEKDKYNEDKWCMMEGHIIQTESNNMDQQNYKYAASQRKQYKDDRTKY